MKFLKSVSVTSVARALAIAGLVLGLPATAHAQAGFPTNGATADAIKGYNDFTGTGEKYVAISAADEVAQMGAGVSAVASWDGYWTGGPTKFKLSDFRKIKAAGFNTVRIPLSTFGKTSMHIDTQGHLDPKYLQKLDTLVDAALQAKLFVIIDEHDYDDCSNDVDACARILPNVWSELSAHYKTAPSSVMFELLNEPHDKIDAAIWNAWIPDLVEIVRETNPTRNLIVGPTHWNSLADLPQLQLPADKHIIVTFHYYEPMTFTHQGASWVGPEIQKEHGEVHWTGTPEQTAKLNGDFDQVAAWARANDRPIFLGEFGTYGKYSPTDERADWTRAVAKAAADRGFARAAWYFNDDATGFGMFDFDTGQWIEPIKDAILAK